MPDKKVVTVLRCMIARSSNRHVDSLWHSVASRNRDRSSTASRRLQSAQLKSRLNIKRCFVTLSVPRPTLTRTTRHRGGAGGCGCAAGRAGEAHRQEARPQTGRHAATPHRPETPAGVSAASGRSKNPTSASIGWQGLTTAEYLHSGENYLVTGTDFANGRIA